MGHVDWPHLLLKLWCFNLLPKDLYLILKSPRPSGGMSRGMKNHSVFWDVCVLEDRSARWWCRMDTN